MPAPASLSIAAVADQVGGLDLPDPVVLAPGLRDVLGGSQIRASVAVSATAWPWCSPWRCARSRPGARSFVAVAEWVADLPVEVATMLGTGRRCPSESTIRRVLGKVDADRFDAVIGAFVQRLCAQVAPAGPRRVLAVDGKTLRGSRHLATRGKGKSVEVAGRHLLAVIDQHTGSCSDRPRWTARPARSTASPR